LLSVISVMPFNADAQTFAGEKVPHTSLALFKSFTSYEVFEIDASSRWPILFRIARRVIRCCRLANINGR
jgi:hypothetical protein